MPITFISVLRTGFYKTVKQKSLKSDEGLPRKATKKIEERSVLMVEICIHGKQQVESSRKKPRQTTVA